MSKDYVNFIQHFAKGKILNKNLNTLSNSICFYNSMIIVEKFSFKNLCYESKVIKNQFPMLELSPDSV